MSNAKGEEDFIRCIIERRLDVASKDDEEKKKLYRKIDGVLVATRRNAQQLRELQLDAQERAAFRVQAVTLLVQLSAYAHGLSDGLAFPPVLADGRRFEYTVKKELSSTGTLGVVSQADCTQRPPLGHPSQAATLVEENSWGGRMMAIKRMNQSVSVDRDHYHSISGQVNWWRHLVHDSINPLIGVIVTASNQLSTIDIITPWMFRGCMLDYVRSSKPTVAELNSMLYDVATGLQYLHAHEIVHGNLQAKNVMVKDHMKICLVDFGFRSQPHFGQLAMNSEPPVDVRWFPPELLGATHTSWAFTSHSDVYALACLFLESYTLAKPFADIQRNTDVVRAVVHGTHPFRPTLSDCKQRALSDGLWEVMMQCWCHEVDERCSAALVVSGLKYLNDNSREIFIDDADVAVMESMPLGTLIDWLRIKEGDINDFINALERFLKDTRREDYLPSLTPAERTTLRRRSIRLLRKVSSHYGIMPAVMVKSVTIANAKEPDFRGGYGDVFKGLNLDKEDVAVKLIRVHTQVDWTLSRKSLLSELTIWWQLQHDNIVPLLGVDPTYFETGWALVSPWMDKGTITSFLGSEEIRELSPTKVTQIMKQLLLQAAAGLRYLHEQNIMHGDVRADNVMIGKDRIARITDFGLAWLASITTRNSDDVRTTHYRWLAPELIIFDYVILTEQSDVYALACVYLEAYTLDKPHQNTKNDATVVFMAYSGQSIPRPQPEQVKAGLLSDGVWALLQDCWSRDPSSRPSVSGYIDRLRYLD